MEIAPLFNAFRYITWSSDSHSFIKYHISLDATEPLTVLVITFSS
jgi:hypothetical protein